MGGAWLSWQQQKEPGVFAVVCQGKEAGRFCYAFALPSSGTPGTSGESPDLVAVGCGGPGVRGAIAFHPSFVSRLSLAQPCSEWCWGKLADTGAGAGRKKRGQAEERWGRGGRGQRVSRLPFGAHGARSTGRRLSRESVPPSFQTRLFIIKKRLASLSVLCHWEGGRTGWRRARPGCRSGCTACGNLPLVNNTAAVGRRCSGALASKTGAVTGPIWGSRFRF